jgi:hypothetical protein
MAELASYLFRVTRLLLVCALALVIVSSAAGAATAPPHWLQHAAHKAASTLSDGTTPTAIAYIAPQSRFPRLVLTGSFVCDACSHLQGPAPRGNVVVMRFDGKTHQSLDFGLCRERAPCEATLCSGSRCSHTRLALSAALTALEHRRGDSAPFGQQLGRFDCHINLSRRGLRHVIGSCTTAVRLQGAHAAIVRFTERWRREYRHGRWVNVPPRTHTLARVRVA